MEKIITYETLRRFAYSNDHLIKGEIKGIVLYFCGLGNVTIHDKDPGDAMELAQKGIVFVAPYCNPWAWMNKQAVSYTDEILDVLFEKYNLPENTRVVSSGGSMGGQSALVYTKYAKRTPVACILCVNECALSAHAAAA